MHVKRPPFGVRYKVVNKRQLLKFIAEAHKAGYAAGEAANKVKEQDGSTTLTYGKGSWKYHDNYFGGEPFGGREVAFFENKPVWMMVYWGRVNESVKDFEAVYTFLRKALKLVPEEAPYRGPKEFTDGQFKYTNAWKGSVGGFSGKESIYQNQEKVYETRYIGGFVDLRKED